MKGFYHIFFFKEGAEKKRRGSPNILVYQLLVFSNQ